MAKDSSIFLNLAGLGPLKVKKIAENVSDLDQIFEIKPYRLRRLSFLNRQDIDRIVYLRKSNLFESQIKKIKENKIEVIDFFDASYPRLLRQIDSPPLVLYIKGNKDLLNSFSVAVVGTRNPTSYGKTAAFDFSAKLAEYGLTVVSGLARGIDSHAHSGALAFGGPTLAVLGSGLNYIYPRQNKKLAESIFNKGLLVSEFPLDTAPLPENFPRRNRIISGLSKGVVVIEAAKRSGALITANFALSQNREVFALPGLISCPQSQGPHALIKEGAKLIDSIEDILDELNLPKEKRVNINKFNRQNKRLQNEQVFGCS